MGPWLFAGAAIVGILGIAISDGDDDGLPKQITIYNRYNFDGSSVDFNMPTGCISFKGR